MIRRNGPQVWKNVHVTHTAQVADLLDVDNSVATGPQPAGFDLLKQAARDLDDVARQARDQGRRVRGLGSGWALTDVAVTDGWLVNTKLLNGCFDLADRFFEPSYPADRRRLLVLAQCGVSVAELNTFLEVTATVGFRRALKTAGIGAGQTIAGAVSGNTHGAAVNFGAMPDFVVGLHIVTGSGRSLWVERASQPVLNDEFTTRLDADRVRDDDVFDAALVSFGAFGVVTAVALETDPVYHLDFRPVNDVPHDVLKRKLDTFDPGTPAGLHHYEFVFDPYADSPKAMEAVATRVAYDGERPAPTPVWIVRDQHGFALGDHAAGVGARFPLVSAKRKTAVQFAQYRERCILGGVRGTPGQLFTATISYFEGFTESAFAVSVADGAKTIEVSTEVVRRMGLPAMSQVRMVHPTRALLGFTCHGPKTLVFEFGLFNDATYAKFEHELTAALAAEGVAYTFHWSKNSGLDAERVLAMYGPDRVARWRAARARVFGGDAALMAVFDNDHLRRAGLA